MLTIFKKYFKSFKAMVDDAKPKEIVFDTATNDHIELYRASFPDKKPVKLEIYDPKTNTTITHTGSYDNILQRLYDLEDVKQATVQDIERRVFRVELEPYIELRLEDSKTNSFIAAMIDNIRNYERFSLSKEARELGKTVLPHHVWLDNLDVRLIVKRRETTIVNEWMTAISAIRQASQYREGSRIEYIDEKHTLLVMRDDVKVMKAEDDVVRNVEQNKETTYALKLDYLTEDEQNYGKQLFPDDVYEKNAIIEVKSFTGYALRLRAEMTVASAIRYAYLKKDDYDIRFDKDEWVLTLKQVNKAGSHEYSNIVLNPNDSTINKHVALEDLTTEEHAELIKTYGAIARKRNPTITCYVYNNHTLVAKTKMTLASTLRYLRKLPPVSRILYWDKIDNVYFETLTETDIEKNIWMWNVFSVKYNRMRRHYPEMPDNLVYYYQAFMSRSKRPIAIEEYEEIRKSIQGYIEDIRRYYLSTLESQYEPKELVRGYHHDKYNTPLSVPDTGYDPVALTATAVIASALLNDDDDNKKSSSESESTDSSPVSVSEPYETSANHSFSSDNSSNDSSSNNSCSSSSDSYSSSD